MFVLCPHCQFLVALDVVSGQPPSHCPRCKELLQPAGPSEHDHPATPEDAVSAQIVAPSTDEDGPPPQSLDPEALTQPFSAAADDSVPVAIVDDDRIVEISSTPVAVPAPRSMSALRRPAPRWLRATIIPLLLVTLLLQSLLADRQHLAADARWRPLVVGLCGLLHCQVPAWREPSAFALLDRNVRSDPHHPGVLQVTATFRNDARWRQPWPSLLLTLSDADGQVAGQRLLTPTEYLGTRPTQNGLESGQSASVSFEVVEPARHSVAFTFDLR
jgi:hypothetical protein